MISFKKAKQILKVEREDYYKYVKILLEKASESYYNTGNLILSDTEYDELSKLYFDKTGEIIIGAKPQSDEKGIISVSHKYDKLVGTLTKCNSVNDFKNWLLDKMKKLGLDNNQVPSLLVSLKFDGNSVAIEYKKGKVVKALTRGEDGKGVDLTDVFKNDTINYNNNCGIKYEVIVTDDNLKKLSELLNKDYVNNRSIASGLLGKDDCKDYREYLTLVPLEMRYENKVKSREDSLEDFDIIFGEDCLFFTETFILDCSEENYSIDSVMEEIEEFYDRMSFDRFNLPFMIDGIVLEILDEDYRTELGYDSENRPNYSTALKFPYAEKTTEVTGMDFCFGDSGRITPRVWFKPVKFFGATQTKQNLHNYKRFKEMKLGVGSKVLIQYRNDCLSYVMPLDCSENKNIEPIPFTKICPVCKQESVKIRVNEKGEETFAYCDNPNCEGKIVGRLQNYVTKMGIKGIKENTLEKLKENKLVRTIEDLYTMDYSKVSKIDGLGDKTSKMLESKFAKDKSEYYDYQLLGSLGIDNISTVNAKLFCTFFSLKNVLDDIFNNKDIKTYYNKVMDIRGFSEIQTNYLLEGISNNFNTLEFLLNKLNVKSYKDTVEANKDDVSLKIVFTGFRDPDLQNKLEMKGHKITSSVSGKTNLVVAANPNDNTVKIQNAIKNGIEVISISELKKRFNL